MSKRIAILFIILAGVLFSEEYEETYVVEERILGISSSIRVKAIAEKSEKISNPVRWQPVKTIIPDGSKVKAGDVLATFVSAQSEYDLETLLLRKKVIDANLQRRLKGIDNRNLDLDDQMSVLEDKLAALKSKLERQKSEPTEDDIRIVEGRLRIAAMNLEAARKDCEKAQDRFRREMISRAELDSAEKDLREKEARHLYATRELEYTRKPPEREANIRITEGEIKMAELEIDKLAFEIKEQQKISEIQKEGAVINKQRIDREIKEKREDIERVVVKAPQDGFVSANRFDNNDIVPGTRMWMNFGFLEMPQLDTMVFKGVLLESRRQYHQEGDKVEVRLNGYKDVPIMGRIKSISTLSHDLAEKENTALNRDRRFGVNVFDVIIVPDGIVDWLRPGMYGEAELFAEKEQKGLMLPMRFVKQHEGKSYISVGGVYREVSGSRIDSEFILDDPKYTGVTVGIGGRFAVEHEVKGEDERRLSATGELLPVRSTSIMVPRIGWWPWPKITWLAPEESMVKKGDVVAKLDPKEREKQVTEDEAQLTEVKSNKDELERKMEITRRNAVFKEKNAEYRLANVREETSKTLDIVPPAPVASAELSLTLAEIKLKDQQRKVDRERAKATPTVSPAELRKMERELLRSKLKLEQATLKLEKAREGASKIARSRAQLNLKDAEDGLEQVNRQNVYDNLAVLRDFERSKQRLGVVEKRLEYRRQQVADHTIYAPEDGLLCYNKVYNNGAITKVAVGNTVGPRFNILSIPDLSEMELKVEVDEKYYSQIRDGMEVEVVLPSLGEDRLVGVVVGIDLVFANRSRKDSQLGLYSSHEPLGEVIFCVRIRIKRGNVALKPGLVGQVLFPIPR